ncbi:PRC and DUF2382 domain-containing protein [Nocardiopsis listeri]|uniref:PRC and DUF2382 domain-containing protein n=1 Tax=Nocardiopsis listeri TaxID=53440 RepID=UPI000835359B|nr:PRC and DUF2382 domain-containing protein [Nocardiopsis listeri]
MTSELVPENLIGHHVLDPEGNNVGKIKQVFLDDRTGEPSWVSVHTGLFGMKETLVPLQGARPKAEDIQIPYDKATVKDAPQVEADRHVAPEDEALVRDYFAKHGGVPRQSGGETDDMTGPPIAGERRPGTDEARVQETDSWTGEDDTVGRARSGERLGGPVDPEAEDVSMIRHEEQVDIGVERRESGQARMRRYVDTERFEETVPVHHDELEVERRPITDPSQVTDEGDLEEGEQSFTLYEERPVVSKKNVPVEEVHVRKRDVSHEEHVEGEVRKERFEIDGEEGTPPSDRE